MAAAAICSIAFTSCQKNFEEYNTNQFEVTAEQASHDDLLVKSYFSQIQRNVIMFADGQKLDSDYQVSYALCADAWCGYLSTTPFRNGVNTGSFYIVDGWTRSLWSNKYELTMNAWTLLNEIALEAGRSQIVALGNILKVASMHQVADAYGAMPYSQVGIELAPKYDSQEEVFNSFFKDLDEGIDALTNYYNAGNTSILADADNVYEGDVAKWIKFANSLRLRLAMRVVYANPSLAQAEAEKSVNHALGVIEQNADNAVMGGVNHHPWYEINVNFNDGDCQLNANLDVYLNGYNDPRKFAYGKPAADGELHGVRNGVHTSDFSLYRNSSGKVSAPKSEGLQITWFNAAESWFLKAEGALRGWNMGVAAKAAYEKGIAVSFDEWGVSGADTYAANTTLVPSKFVDNTGKGSDAPAPSTCTIAYDEDGAFETCLEKIMTQKWLAVYPNGSEAWAEYRRTRYPHLLTPVNNDSEGLVDTQLQIRRIPYPVSEYSTNPKGVAVGVSVLGGADNAGTKVWWDKKN